MDIDQSTTRALMVRGCSVLGLSLLAAATFAAPAMAGGGAAGLIPSQGEIVREGTLLNGPCSGKPLPQVNFEDSTRNWGPDKDGTPFTAMDVYTEFTALDSQGQAREINGQLVDAHAGHWMLVPPPGGCVYDDDASLRGIKADERGIWLMRVHHVQVHTTFDSVTGWVAAAGDGRDVTTDIRFEVVSANTCGNSAWVGLGPTDPACFNQHQKKEAAELAKQERQDLQIEQADYRSMCGLGKLHGSMDFRSGKAGACIGYQWSIKSQASDAQANQRLANDPPNPDYMTIAVPQAPAQAGLARLPAAWTAYRAVLTDLDWVTADSLALVSSIERANGAYAATAKNPAADTWTQRQNDASHNLVLNAGSRIDDANDKLPEARHELLDSGVPEAEVNNMLDGVTKELTMTSELFNDLL